LEQSTPLLFSPFIAALIKVRTANLTQVALTLNPLVLPAPNYHRIQRFCWFPCRDKPKRAYFARPFADRQGFYCHDRLYKLAVWDHSNQRAMDQYRLAGISFSDPVQLLPKKDSLSTVYDRFQQRR
jgi:hypothetical protein